MRASVLGLVAAVLMGSAGVANAASVNVLWSEPAAGAVVAELTHVDVVFSQDVDIPSDGATLVSPDGTSEPAGPAEPLSDGTIRVPVPDAATGLWILSLTGTVAGSDDPVSASVPFSVGSPVGTFDAGRATSAASGAELARAIVGVGVVAFLVALVWMLVRSLRARRAGSPGVVPLRPLLVASGCVALIGAILGVWMGVRGAAASAGDLIDRMSGSPLVVWCLAAVIILLVVMVVSGRLWRGAVGYGLGVASAVGVVIVLGGVASAALPQSPAGDVDLRTSTESGVQASLTLSPAAVGRNALAVQLGGMPSAADQPLLVVRPLDGRVNSMYFPLAPEGDGVFVSDDVVLPFSGRWRAEIRAVPGATAEDPLVVDFDVQSNPGAVDGSGS